MQKKPGDHFPPNDVAFAKNAMPVSCADKRGKVLGTDIPLYSVTRQLQVGVVPAEFPRQFVLCELPRKCNEYKTVAV